MSWELAGWSAQAAGGVLAVAAGCVTLLYLLALRRRPIEVPFVHLWREALTDERSSQLFSRLKRVLSWLLAVLLVALVTGALADPRARGHGGSERLVVIAVDVSASMGAMDGSQTRIERARERARAIVRGLGASDRAIVVAMGAEARPASAATTDHAALLAAIDALRPLDVVADADAAAHLGCDVSAGVEHREVVLVSDGAVAHEAEARARLAACGLSARHDAIGSAAANLAITALSVRRYPLDPSRNELLLEVTSASDELAAVEVELLGDGETVDLISLDVPARGRVRRFFQDLTGVDRALEARLRMRDGSHDALAADDHAFARVPPRRRVRVAVVSADDIYLEAALLLDEYLDVREVAPGDFPPPEPFDVAILDRFVPSVPIGADAIWLDPTPADGAIGPLEITGAIERPFFDHLRREDPLLRHAALSDVNVARALLVRPHADDVVVAADARGPLIVRGERAGHRFVALTFDVRESDLPLRPAFPLLLLDAIESFAPTDAAYRGSVITGAPASIALPPSATRAWIVDADGTRLDLPTQDGAATVRFERAGFHTIETDATDVLVAANLPAASELDLAPRTLDLGGHDDTASSLVDDAARLPWQWLTLAALALLLVEWATFHRRWTV